MSIYTTAISYSLQEFSYSDSEHLWSSALSVPSPIIMSQEDSTPTFNICAGKAKIKACTFDYAGKRAEISKY